MSIKPRQKKIFVSWQEYDNLVFSVFQKLRADGLKPDYIIGLATGGVTPATMFRNLCRTMNKTDTHVAFWSAENWPNGQKADSLQLAQEMTYTKPPPPNGIIAILDDTTDSGETLKGAKSKVAEIFPQATIITITLWHKASSPYEPNYYAKKVEPDEHGLYPWIVQPFEEEKWEKFTSHL